MDKYLTYLIVLLHFLFEFHPKCSFPLGSRESSCFLIKGIPIPLKSFKQHVMKVWSRVKRKKTNRSALFLLCQVYIRSSTIGRWNVCVFFFFLFLIQIKTMTVLHDQIQFQKPFLSFEQSNLKIWSNLTAEIQSDYCRTTWLWWLSRFTLV